MLIKTTIVGTRPILIHKYTVSTASKPTTRSKNQSFDQEWRKNTYINDDGFLVIPHQNLMACLFDGTKGMKKGKTTLTRALYYCLTIAENEVLLLYEGKPIHINDVEKKNWIFPSGVVISGRRIDRLRTMIPAGWSINFTIETYQHNILDETDIKKIIESSGRYAGLGDWRLSSPKKPGSYGQFDIKEFIVQK